MEAPLDDSLIIAAKLLMQQHNGIGLAAPQLGINEQWFIMNNTLMVNPELRWESAMTTRHIEGCLSLPGELVEIERAYEIKVWYKDKDLKPHEATLRGLEARIFLHEFDHLNGKLITDYV